MSCVTNPQLGQRAAGTILPVSRARSSAIGPRSLSSSSSRRRAASRSRAEASASAAVRPTAASSRSSRASSVRRLCDWSSSSVLQPTRNSRPQDSQARSLWRPMSVGAIDPVGITKASASKARNKSASVKATTIDSIVSTQPGNGFQTVPSAPRPAAAGRASALRAAFSARRLSGCGPPPMFGLLSMNVGRAPERNPDRIVAAVSDRRCLLRRPAT